MQVTLSQNPFTFIAPVEISAIDQEYLNSRLHYEKQRRVNAFKLRRQLIRKRGLFRRQLERALSAQLRAELNIRVVLDGQYLQRPGFIGVFEESGKQWILNFQSHPFGGRWYFRSPQTSTLYTCSSRHLETQLCYALGQDRFHSLPLARA